MTTKKKRLNPNALTELPEPSEIDAALDELNFNVPAQAAEGHELLRVVGLLGALETWNESQRVKEKTP